MWFRWRITHEPGLSAANAGEVTFEDYNGKQK